MIKIVIPLIGPKGEEYFLEAFDGRFNALGIAALAGYADIAKFLNSNGYTSDHPVARKHALYSPGKFHFEDALIEATMDGNISVVASILLAFSTNGEHYSSSWGAWREIHATIVRPIQGSVQNIGSDLFKILLLVLQRSFTSPDIDLDLHGLQWSFDLATNLSYSNILKLSTESGFIDARTLQGNDSVVYAMHQAIGEGLI